MYSYEKFVFDEMKKIVKRCQLICIIVDTEKNIFDEREYSDEKYAKMYMTITKSHAVAKSVFRK